MTKLLQTIFCILVLNLGIQSVQASPGSGASDSQSNRTANQEQRRQVRVEQRRQDRTEQRRQDRVEQRRQDRVAASAPELDGPLAPVSLLLIGGLIALCYEQHKRKANA